MTAPALADHPAAIACDTADAQATLGACLLGLEQFDAAERALRGALARDPLNAQGFGYLGALLLRTGRPVASETASRQAIALAPDEPRWIANLAAALHTQGRHFEAETQGRRALALQPDDAAGHGVLLLALNDRHDLPSEVIFAEYQRWDARHGRRWLPAAPVRRLDPIRGRRLRIGYVSPGFRQHTIAWFAEPLIAAHNRSKVELFLYAEVSTEDETTMRFRALADHWRTTAGHDDAAVAAMIRHDRIDVLVDLGGHTAGGRMLVFARRPAPVQLTGLLGHGGTSGLSAVDAFLGNVALVPPNAEALFSEPVIRLPRIPIVYQPPANMPPVAPLPARSNGYVTFGYFGRPERLNPTVTATWSRILRAVPGSHLVLNNRAYQEPEFCDLVAERFAVLGVPRDRIDMIYTAPQPCTWVAYGAIDIALDPFPHNAGTTAMEALWQGVPVVTLASRPGPGRLGSAILGAIALDDWIADDPDAYAAHAIAAAANIDALARLRATLRSRFEASPLRDAPGLARCLEATYRALCERQRPDSPLGTPQRRMTDDDPIDEFASERDRPARQAAVRLAAARVREPMPPLGPARSVRRAVEWHDDGIARLEAAP